LLAAAAVVFVVVPTALPTYVQNLLSEILILGIFAMSLDLLMGYTGLLSLGHAAYFGVAAYVTGLIVARYGIDTFWIIAPLAILAATLTSAIFSVVALRVSGVYFMLVTFALGQLLYSVAHQWRYLTTGGAEGITGIRRPTLGVDFRWDSLKFYFFVLVLFAIAAFLMRRIVQSPFGVVLRGIRENEARMRTLGYNTWRYKYAISVISGAAAGLAGMLFAFHLGVVSPTIFDFTTSGGAMFMVIIGGTGTLYGPVVGAAVIQLIEFYASDIVRDRAPMIVGIVFVVSIMFLRAGVGVAALRLWRRLLRQAPATG
jgi:branched-chain amino acid transport system permease protein